MTTLRRLPAVALLALALAACGDDGFSPLQPTRGLAGTWVRGPENPMWRIAVAADTLFVADGKSAVWSRQGFGVNGPARMREPVVLSVAGPAIYLSFTPCDPMLALCLMATREVAVPDAPRATSIIPSPHYRIVRDGADRLVLEPVGYMTGDIEYYYRR